jgi:RNA polymerase sigma-70 factor (ECF subfamily)
VDADTAKINIDESVLIEQCRLGEAQAMECLILRYQNRIYNTVLKICANCDDAAELTQDAFVKAIENINNFKGKSSFYTWLFRIAVNLTLTHCSRNVKLGMRSLDSTQAQQDNTAGRKLKDFLSDDGSADPAEIAGNKELCELVIAALMKLDENHRAVIVLRDIEQMSYAQIAEVLNINLGTVRSRLSRARSSLREMMEAVYDL